jgi:hypothetical protein
MSYVYESFEPGLYTVGYYDGDGHWHPEGDYGTRVEARQAVHYLNGGNDE